MPRNKPIVTPIMPRVMLSEKNIQNICLLEEPTALSMPISNVRSPTFKYIVFNMRTTATHTVKTDIICKPD